MNRTVSQLMERLFRSLITGERAVLESSNTCFCIFCLMEAERRNDWVVQVLNMFAAFRRQCFVQVQSGLYLHEIFTGELSNKI